MKERKVSVKKKLENGLLVDTETGEVIELKPSSSMFVEEQTNNFVIETNNYVSITPEAIEYLTENCKKTDIPKILLLSTTTRTDFNVSFNSNNKPHNIETLSTYLKLNKRELFRLINRLTKQNILAYAYCAPSGSLQKIIMLNPYIARRRTKFANELKVIFSDITKKR